ncbi:MAG: hypothetical protein Q4P72_00010 [Eubacteriales bacterium]|nr:hypothetical protein [Eubacteriales bacterium]
MRPKSIYLRARDKEERHSFKLARRLRIRSRQEARQESDDEIFDSSLSDFVDDFPLDDGELILLKNFSLIPDQLDFRFQDELCEAEPILDLEESAELLRQASLLSARRFKIKSPSKRSLVQAYEKFISDFPSYSSETEVYEALLKLDSLEREELDALLVRDLERLYGARPRLRSDLNFEDVSEISGLALEAKSRLFTWRDPAELARFTGGYYLLSLQEKLLFHEAEQRSVFDRENEILQAFEAFLANRHEMENPGVRRKYCAQVYREIAQARFDIASYFSTSSYSDLIKDVLELEELPELEIHALRESLKSDFAELYYALLNQDRVKLDSERSGLWQGLFSRVAEGESENDYRREQRLAAIVLDREGLVGEVLKLAIFVLRHGSGEDSTSEEAPVTSKREPPELVLLRNRLYVEAFDSDALRSFKQGNKRIEAFARKLRPFEHVPPAFLRAKGAEYFYFHSLSKTILLLPTIAASYEIWDLIAHLGRCYRFLLASEQSLLVEQESPLRLAELFSGHAFELLAMLSIREAQARCKRYLDRLRRRAETAIQQGHSYGEKVAQQALQRLRPYQKRWQCHAQERNKLMRRRLIKYMEELLLAAAIDEFEEQLYSGDMNDLEESWKQILSTYFKRGVRHYDIAHPSLIHGLLYRPFDARKQWLAMYAALVFADRSTKDVAEGVDAYAKFCRGSQERSFISGLAEIGIDDLCSRSTYKRICYQLAVILEHS